MEDLQQRYRAIRSRTEALAAPLSAEDCCVQSMPDASPVKWHLAHTTWFFETFILERHERDFHPFQASYRVLFNSYYNGVGDKHPRPQRGLLTRPALAEVLAYRRQVDERMSALLSSARDDKLRALLEVGLQHEQQHQELILTDIKHLLSLNPLQPAYSSQAPAASSAPSPLVWREFEGGVVHVGHAGEDFCFDNEQPRHRQFLEAYSLADRLTTNGEYLEFVLQGGYEDPALWLSEGWDWVQANKLAHPLYWRRDGGHWSEFTLHGLLPLEPHRPLVHVSFFEADAYARWRGVRLPTEAEWEAGAGAAPDFGAQSLHPEANGGEQADRRMSGLSGLFGSAWQWTLSSYAPYPGYRPAAGAIGEYNGKFMSNQYVLRGSSCVTPARHARVSYRNFFPSTARWQFSGIRLARSL